MSRTPKSKRKRAHGAAQSTPTVPAVIEPEVLPPKDPDDLEQLAKRIRNAHHRVMKRAADTLMAAMEAGDALSMAKEKLDHGEFMSWLAEHCSVSGRSARGYMRLAEHRGLIEKRVKLAMNCQFGISEALSWLKLVVTEEPTTTEGEITPSEKVVLKNRRKQVKRLSETTPEEHLAKLDSIWPPDKLIKLGQLITAQFKPSENC
jgi:Protein of unknown function (DUF3102)